MSSELEYAIKANKKAIIDQHKKFQQEMLRLEMMIEQEDWLGYGQSLVDGFFAKEAAKMAGLVGRQQALVEVRGMDLSAEGQK